MIGIVLEDKKRAIVKALMAQKVLVTKQVLDALKDESMVDKYYDLHVAGSVSGLQIPVSAVHVPSSNFVADCANIPASQQSADRVEIVSQYVEESKKWTMQDFVHLFNARLKALGKLLQGRQELQNLTSIARVGGQQNDVVSVIGLVSDVQKTKKENMIITLEDASGGQVKAIVTQRKPDVYALAKDVVLDEVIGVVGMAGDNAIFVNSIVFPDVPLPTEIKKSPVEEYAVVISDVHVGSNLFLEQEFRMFLKWVKGLAGTPAQREMARKAKYVFVVGDLVDGVGIYPSQERELATSDIFRQYEDAAKLLSEIPVEKKMIICPGNHDAVRIAEPQPLLPKDICGPLWALSNVTMVTNPAVVRIAATPDFPGFDFLLYHGYSYDYYGNVVESIKNSGRHISDKTDLIMKFLLQRRHLAPTHTSTLYVPDPSLDPLIIDTVPDFFLSGHVHRAAVNAYHGVTVVVSSCFQAKTGFQEKVGHEPTPCHVPVIGLHTRKVTMLNFSHAADDSIEEVVELKKV